MITPLRTEAMRNLVPGVVLCGTVAMAASFLTLHYGAPVMLFALLLGMAFNFVDPAGKFEPGVTFSSKTLLRLGVALLGVKVTLAADVGAKCGFRTSERRCRWHLRGLGGAGNILGAATRRQGDFRARHHLYRGSGDGS